MIGSQEGMASSDCNIFIWLDTYLPNLRRNILLVSTYTYFKKDILYYNLERVYFKKLFSFQITFEYMFGKCSIYVSRRDWFTSCGYKNTYGGYNNLFKRILSEKMWRYVWENDIMYRVNLLMYFWNCFTLLNQWFSLVLFGF